jgi:hypothetical protein
MSFPLLSIAPCISFRYKRNLSEQLCKQACTLLLTHALVAQWIERLVAVQKVAGPIPAKRTKRKRQLRLSFSFEVFRGIGCERFPILIIC